MIFMHEQVSNIHRVLNKNFITFHWMKQNVICNSLKYQSEYETVTNSFKPTLQFSNYKFIEFLMNDHYI